jgi:histone H3/H4
VATDLNLNCALISLDGDERRATMGFGQESGFGLDVIPDGNESTFMLNVQPPVDEDASLPVPDLEPDAANGSLLDEQPMDDYSVLPLEDDGALESDVEDLEGLEGELTALDADEIASLEARARLAKKRKKGVKVSRYGHEYPSLPPAVVKRLAQTFAQTSGISKSKVNQDTLTALCQATDWFFEQLGDDLQAYARHAGRKTIDESDVITLLRR